MNLERAAVNADRATLDGAGVVGDPDRTAVDDAKAGDTGAFEALVLRYQTRIVNYASAMVRDAGGAEDVAQETFVRAWRGLGRFRGESSFKTWLYRIATNVARTHLDRRRPSGADRGPQPGQRVRAAAGGRRSVPGPRRRDVARHTR